MSTQKDFQDKVVLITGSSSGIGKDVAIYLASLGAKLAITGRNEQRLQAVAQNINEKYPETEVLSVCANVNNDDDLQRLIRETIEKYKKLNVLINNAGIYQVCTFEDENYLNFYDNIMNTNLRSVLALTRLAIPYLVQSKGNIINVSSVASHKPGSLNAIYAMSKVAIDMFTKSLAIEYGPKGVRVNAINPAAIRTPIFDKVENYNLSTDKMAEATSKSYPLGRIGETIDCAKAIAYLASEDASFVSGVTLLIDGASVSTPLVIPTNNN